ncbi:MAG: L,D-transpeptidase [Rhizobiales bacterium]|nr:L,D-transpeptidase [Hyphomicrobiales bacterium]
MKFWTTFGTAMLVLAFSAMTAQAGQVKYNFSGSTFEEPDKKKNRSVGFTSSYRGKKTVSFNRNVKPGTIVIKTGERRLYYVLPGGRAIKYGIGVGRQGFTWRGRKRVSRKAEWPDWRPPARMIAREKKKGRNLPAFMPGGINNPLGARAMYLGGSIYRIHGTNQASTIGQAVSSGCIRMRNDEVTDLYKRVRIGALVIVE